eukprot:gnl/MRDRNA2_/MRDRNA2_185324_c0_seq1.p1 gnl/MRDRNA2_/MRDRNA2_185324_c0~~gnl/MRDRNA2_/MRDRNA2_185324_c0_seq1.p1  ORF type:complete len:247 (-),score=40.89 gnl/MRDRNA2_/MRDRNA2_185324_c0_seq1:776-1516(-)
MSPVTVRHGHMVVHINEVSMLQEVIPALRAEDVTSHGDSKVNNERVMSIRSTASSIQHCIAESLNLHCSSLRDAIFHLKRRRGLSSSLFKKLMRINAADTLLRHTSAEWMSSVEAESQNSCAKACNFSEDHALPVKNSFLHFSIPADDNSDSCRGAPAKIEISRDCGETPVVDCKSSADNVPPSRTLYKEEPELEKSPERCFGRDVEAFDIFDARADAQVQTSSCVRAIGIQTVSFNKPRKGRVNG